MTGSLRFVIAPRPGLADGPAISLLRLQNALRLRGHSTQSQTFRFLGYTPFAWDVALLMGVPAHANRLLNSAKPKIMIVGKPEIPSESAANSRKYTAADDDANLLRARAMMQADHIAFISNYVRSIWDDWFRSNGMSMPDEQKNSIIYHGIDLSRFRPAIKGRTRKFTIGCFGALRTPVRINAIAEVSRRLSIPHDIMIVGSITPQCRRQIENLQSASSFPPYRWVPWVNPDSLPTYMHAIDCLLHPVDHEGFGIVMSEAMACGVPVVAPAHGAAAEIVSPGGAIVPTRQFVYDTHFYDALAEGVETIHSDLPTFSIAARVAAEERFDINRIAEKFEAVACELVKQ